jgi:hypothetical protein
MSAIAPITIVDGKASPASHVFNPVQSVDPATYSRNGDASVPVVGQEKVLLSLKNGANTSEAVNRAKITLLIPVLETPAGGTPTGYVAPPKVAFFEQVNIEFLLPNRGTSDQRKDLRVMASNLLLNAQVVALVDTLEKPY